MNVINYHLTDSCNYGCKYCFGKFAMNDLTLEQACSVVDNVYRYFVKNGIADGRINLAGGEPLLYPHLDELIDYICAYGIKVSIITNGSLLTKERIASWRGKVCCIGLSLDSALPETDAVIGRCCQGGKVLTLRNTVSLAQAIHRNGIKLKINTVVSKLNVNEDMRTFYKRLKPNRLKLLQMEIVEGVNDAASQYAISKKQFDKFCDKHRRCCRDTVCEYSDSIENSYLIINPQGGFQVNNFGKCLICGDCLQEELDDIVKRAPINREKFDVRYGIIRETSAKPVYIFGGHESWRKGIKKHLHSAQIFREDNLHSLDVIRNADVIWIQPNAISHPFYYKLLDAAKLYGVTVRYFSYSGVKKCVDQVKQLADV